MFFKKRPSWLSERAWIRIMRQRDRRKYLRRQLIRFFRSPRLAFAYAAYRRAIQAADWQSVRDRVKPLAHLAVRAGDGRTIGDMVYALERVGFYRESADLWLAEIAPRKKAFSNEWRGEDLSTRTVLVDLNPPGQGLGTGYRCATIVPRVAELAGRTLVVVDPRLIKTFRRSFPGLEIFSSHEEARSRGIDFVALPEFLIFKFAPQVDAPDPRFRALTPDRDQAAELRRKYLATENAAGRPLVGICWHSSHHGKDLPALRDWRDFIARTDATFVSLQYGDVTQDVTMLGRDRVIVDDSIDQMSDMDGFAAQVAALDGVVTIINTLANVGGALDVPTVVLRDDWFRRSLPVLNDRIPWHPSVRVAGKNRRDWKPVFDEAMAKLQGLLAERSAGSTQPVSTGAPSSLASRQAPP